VLLGALVAGGLIAIASSGSLSAGRVRGWIDGYGVAGPLVFIVVSALLTVVLFPGPLLSGASGLLFGTALGTPVSIVAATLGATLAFSLARWLAHDAVEELQGPRLAALRAWVGRRGFLSILYARIAPGVPYNVVNYAAGLSPVALRSFVAATAVGCAPRAFAYTALGGSIGNLRSPEAVIAIVVLVGMALVGLVLARRDLRLSRAGGGPAGPGRAAPAPETGSSSPAGPRAGPR
jgi:uncharacterized membrane protein YdjX (TVP38/TMEM64 family)